MPQQQFDDRSYFCGIGECERDVESVFLARTEAVGVCDHDEHVKYACAAMNKHHPKWHWFNVQEWRAQRLGMMVGHPVDHYQLGMLVHVIDDLLDLIEPIYKDKPQMDHIRMLRQWLMSAQKAPQLEQPLSVE